MSVTYYESIKNHVFKEYGKCVMTQRNVHSMSKVRIISILFFKKTHIHTYVNIQRHMEGSISEVKGRHTERYNYEF